MLTQKYIAGTNCRRKVQYGTYVRFMVYLTIIMDDQKHLMEYPSQERPSDSTAFTASISSQEGVLKSIIYR